MGLGLVVTGVSPDVDAELPQLNDCRLAPADRVGGERKRERHSVLLPERLAVAQDMVVPGRRLDRQTDGLEPADELADVLSHLADSPPWSNTSGSPEPSSSYQVSSSAISMKVPIPPTLGTLQLTDKFKLDPNTFRLMNDRLRVLG